MTNSPNPLLGMRKLGQSPWCDQLRRRLLESGRLETLIAQGIVGDRAHQLTAGAS
jgi:hypothetical protein